VALASLAVRANLVAAGGVRCVFVRWCALGEPWERRSEPRKRRRRRWGWGGGERLRVKVGVGAHRAARRPERSGGRPWRTCAPLDDHVRNTQALCNQTGPGSPSTRPNVSARWELGSPPPPTRWQGQLGGPPPANERGGGRGGAAFIVRALPAARPAPQGAGRAAGCVCQRGGGWRANEVMSMGVGVEQAVWGRARGAVWTREATPPGGPPGFVRGRGVLGPS
jgi:hypothetical protein